MEVMNTIIENTEEYQNPFEHIPASEGAVIQKKQPNLWKVEDCLNEEKEPKLVGKLRTREYEKEEDE